ncbi:MAG: SDR family NAD(P)-dependent oxidoreductase [Pararhodobacter sp.]
MRGERWWLVGASEGLGRELARAMAAEGASLVLSARSVERIEALAGELGAQAVPVDVSDTPSVAAAAAQIGEVDGVVFLAGAYWPMKAQDWDSDKAAAMIDVNLTGAVRVVGAVLPAMIARNRGRIVLTGSLAGYRGLPGSIGYGASKAGLMNLAQSLQVDLMKTQLRVQLVNPGFIRTRLTAKNDFNMPFLMEADAAAAAMLRAMQGRRPVTAFPAVFSWLFRGGRFLPTALWHRIFG